MDIAPSSLFGFMITIAASSIRRRWIRVDVVHQTIQRITVRDFHSTIFEVLGEDLFVTNIVTFTNLGPEEVHLAITSPRYLQMR